MGIQVIKSGSVSAYLKLAGDVALTSSLVSVVDQANNVSGLQLATASVGLTMPTFLALPNWTNTVGTKDGFSSQQTVAVASVGTGVFRLIRNAYTINNTAAQTGSVTGYFLNATETALNGMTHNLMDLQVGGVSQFLVSKIGNITTKATDWANLNNSGLSITSLNATASNQAGLTLVGTSIILRGTAAGFLWLTVGNTNIDFGNAQTLRWGTTSSFPAIKRNGAAIDFRLADDSAACDITANIIRAAGKIDLYGDGSSGVIGMVTLTNTLNLRKFVKIVGEGGIGANDASAVLQVDGTNRGFLPPRMTTAQVNAIATPAEGLQVYNTTINHMCFYMGGVWVRINHSPM